MAVVLHGARLKSCSSTLSCLSLGEISSALWKLLTGCAVRFQGPEEGALYLTWPFPDCSFLSLCLFLLLIHHCLHFSLHLFFPHFPPVPSFSSLDRFDLQRDCHPPPWPGRLLLLGCVSMDTGHLFLSILQKTTVLEAEKCTK